MPSDPQPPAHPFGPLLEADEPLLWLARPNPDAFRAQQAKVYLYIFVFSFVILFSCAAAFSFIGLATPAYGTAAFAVVIMLIGIILANRTAHGDEEWSVTWYALTPRRLLKQSLDTDAEGGRHISQIALTDVCRLRLRKKYVRLGTSVGTITCYSRAFFVSDHFTLDAIENPDAVLELIEEARAKIAAGAQEAFPHSRFP